MQTEQQTNGTWLASFRTLLTGRLLLAEGGTEQEAIDNLEQLQFERWCSHGITLADYHDIFGAAL